MIKRKKVNLKWNELEEYETREVTTEDVWIGEFGQGDAAKLGIIILNQYLWVG